MNPKISHALSIDYRSLAAFRIMLAVTIFYSAITFFPDLPAFYSEEGILPLSDLQNYFPNHRLSVFSLLTHPAWIYIAWTILITSSTTLLIGYKSRLSAAVCLLIYLSFSGRNPIVLQGGDTLLQLLLFWAIFLPIGMRFSIDGALNLNRDSGSTSDSHFSIATAGVLAQTLYVYFIGALLKTSPAWIPEAQAVSMALHIDSIVTKPGEILRNFPSLLSLLTFFVFYIELLSPILLFYPDKNNKVRSITLSLLILMHIGFRLFLNIGHFWLASLSSLMTFIPSQAWRKASRIYWRKNQESIKIYYDKDCGFCLKTCLIIREFFLPSAVVISPAQNNPATKTILEESNSWIVVKPSGETLLKWDALIYITSQAPLMKPAWLLCYLVGKLKIGEATYEAIGKNRHKLGRLTSMLLPFHHKKNKLNLTTKAFLFLIITLCLTWNIEQLYPPEKRAILGKHATGAMSQLGLAQRWNMFAPHPMISDIHPIITLTTTNGDNYQFLHRKFDKLSHSSSTEEGENFENYRWRKLFNRVFFSYGPEKKGKIFSNYADFVCRKFTESQDARKPDTVSIEIYKNHSLKQTEDEFTTIKLPTHKCP